MYVRKLLIVGLCLGFVAAPVMAAIDGSPHDFVGLGWYGSNDELCKPCHVPHNPNPGPTGTTAAPLWNHQITTNSGYVPYPSGGTISGTIDATPSGVSKLCLSCHDGTVALDAFGTPPGNTTFITGAALVGEDLSNDHPIGITYTTTDGGGLNDPLTAPSGIPGGGTINDDLLFSTKVECASCHDVHDGANQGASGNLLVKSNTNSDLCTTCHNK